jgi:repressor LexA
VYTTVTKRQEKILSFIRDYYLEKGEAPSLGELQEYLLIKTKRGVVSHLEALERKGFIIRTGEPRGIHIQEKGETYDYLIGVPILGYANAGIPIATAVEDYLGILKIDKNLLGKKKNLFAVVVKGDSMNKYSLKGISLNDGNYAIVEKDSEIKNGDPVLAIIDGCATIKILKKEEDMIILHPFSYNKKHRPIYLDKNRENIINGKVVKALEEV